VHNLMHGLLILREVVPKPNSISPILSPTQCLSGDSRGSILQVRLWVPLLRMDENRELARIPQKEDGCVVEDPIVVPFFGVELDGKASRISC